MCGNWNVRQQRHSKCSKWPLISCIVHHALLKFSPCRNKTLPQLVHIADWYSMHALAAYSRRGNLPSMRLSTGFRSGLLAGQMSALMNWGVSRRRSSTVSRAGCLGNTTRPVDFYSKLNEDEVGTGEFVYCDRHITDLLNAERVHRRRLALMSRCFVQVYTIIL